MKKIINKLGDKLMNIDMSWFGALAIVFFIFGMESAMASTGSGTLVTGVKSWYDLSVTVAFYLTLMACICILVVMIFTKNWGLVYWVAGTGIAAYLIGNIEDHMRDVGVTGVLF